VYTGDVKAWTRNFGLEIDNKAGKMTTAYRSNYKSLGLGIQPNF